MIDSKTLSALKKDLKNAGLDEDSQADIISSLEEKVDAQIEEALLKAIDEEDRPRFIALSEGGDDEMLDEYVRQRVDNVDKLVSTITQKTIKEFKTRNGM